MKANLVVLISENPMYLWSLIAESLPTAVLVYALVWVAMRPRRARDEAGESRKPRLIWHGVGIAFAVLGAIVLRVIAAATFAGRSALDSPVGALTAGIEFLVLPALLSTLYILWLRAPAKHSTR